MFTFKNQETKDMSDIYYLVLFVQTFSGSVSVYEILSNTKTCLGRVAGERKNHQSFDENLFLFYTWLMFTDIVFRNIPLTLVVKILWLIYKNHLMSSTFRTISFLSFLLQVTSKMKYILFPQLWLLA